MSSGNSTTGDCLTIRIEAGELPDDEDTLAKLTIDLGTALRDVLSAYGIDPDDLNCTDGHTYTTISDRCPVCDETLRLADITLDTSNGAHATARCDCGWHGAAVYQLVDLHEHPGSTETGVTVDPEQISSVHLYDIEPQYTPY